MEFVRVVKNSDDLAKIIDITKELRNRKVEVIMRPYQNREEIKRDKKSLRGSLSKYKNEEDEAWTDAAVEKHENS